MKRPDPIPDEASISNQCRGLAIGFRLTGSPETARMVDELANERDRAMSLLRRAYAPGNLTLEQIRKLRSEVLAFLEETQS